MVEQKLIDGILRGDRGAQRQVYELTVDKIYRLLLRMTRNPDDAFDLSQETYLQAFRKIEQFGQKSTFETWLYRIAVNEALRFIRRRNRQRDKLREHDADGQLCSTDEETTQRQDVQEALARLEADDQALLALRYQEGLDYRTIAQVTGHPEGTVGSRLNRARAKLRSLLEKSYASAEEAQPPGHLNIRDEAQAKNG